MSDNENLKEKLGWAKIGKLVQQWRVAMPLVDAGLEFKKQPGVLSAIKFGLQVKNVKDSLPKKEEGSFFDDTNWSEISSSVVNKFFYSTMINKGAVLTKKDYRHSWLEFEDHIFGCKVNFSTKEEINPDSWQNHHLYISTQDYQESLKVLQGLFWGHFGQIALFCRNNDMAEFNFEKFEMIESFETALTRKYIEEIRRFKERGYSRSFLFYGPPGTGKSSTAAHILRMLGYKTLVINDIQSLVLNWMKTYVEFLGIEAILVEDIDHMSGSSLNLVLEAFQHLTAKGILVLSTCNKAAKLDDALIRNGRFDECIEINELPEDMVKTIIGDDAELLQTVRQFPIAALLEVKRRLDVLGRDDTLKRMDDISKRVERAKKDDYKL